MTFDFDNEATLMASDGPSVNLLVRQGPQIGLEFSITTNRVVLGREETCDIVIQDAEVSRRHCQISWEGNAYVIQDLGSTNGTFVNGSQIAVPRVLTNGDTLGLGQTTLIFESQEDSSWSQEAYASSAQQQAPQTDFEPTQPQTQQPSLQRWLLIGCGCLLLLCICTATIPILLQFIGVIDLVDVVGGIGFP